MSSCAHFGCLVLLVLVPAATGYGTGAPTKACVSMIPGHNNTNPQTSNSPYTLELEDGGEKSDAMKGRTNFRFTVKNCIRFISL